MTRKSMVLALVVVAFASQTISVSAFAQDAGRGPRGEGGQRPERPEGEGRGEGRGEGGGGRGGEDRGQGGGGRGGDQPTPAQPQPAQPAPEPQQPAPQPAPQPQPQQEGKKKKDRGGSIAGAIIGGIIGGLLQPRQPAPQPPRRDDFDRGGPRGPGRDDRGPRGPGPGFPDRGGPRGPGRDDRGPRGDDRGPRGPRVLDQYELNEQFTRYYVNASTDSQRLQAIEDLVSDLERRNELASGDVLYTIISRLDGGVQKRTTANRADALELLQDSVTEISYRQAQDLESLFPNKAHGSYARANAVIRSITR